VQDGRMADAKTPLNACATPARTLPIRDPGVPESTGWKEEEEHEQEVLTSLRSAVLVFDDQEQPLDR